jgi:hypothetical protein
MKSSGLRTPRGNFSICRILEEARNTGSPREILRGLKATQDDVKTRYYRVFLTA